MIGFVDFYERIFGYMIVFVHIKTYINSKLYGSRLKLRGERSKFSKYNSIQSLTLFDKIS